MILWLGNVFVSGGIGMIIPFLPLYVKELGVEGEQATAIWAAAIFAVNHVMIALTSPIWGRFADKYGQKKMMIPSGIGLAVIISLMGTVSTPLQLLLLRTFFGMMAGFNPASVALMAIETPKEHVGKSLGTLQTGQVTGQLLGPLFGGVMAELVGMRYSFFITGILIFLATVLALFGVKTTRKFPKFEWKQIPELFRRNRSEKKVTIGEVVKQSPIILQFYLSTLLIAFSLQSIGPIITLHVENLNIDSHVELVAGLVLAAAAFGTMLAAPVLGRLGDRYDHFKVLIWSLLAVALCFLPQGLIGNPWLFMGVRFLTGLCIGGLIPSVTSLLRRLTPASIQGSVFAINTSANSAGNVLGSMFGGIIGGTFGIPIVFMITSGIFFAHFLMLGLQSKKIMREIHSRELAM